MCCVRCCRCVPYTAGIYLEGAREIDPSLYDLLNHYSSCMTDELPIPLAIQEDM